jgi:hypothetical protein
MLVIESECNRWVSAISHSFAEERVPIAAGIAIGMLVMMRGVELADRKGLTMIRDSTMASMRNCLRYLETRPTYVEQPDQKM